MVWLAVYLRQRGSPRMQRPGADSIRTMLQERLLAILSAFFGVLPS